LSEALNGNSKVAKYRQRVLAAVLGVIMLLLVGDWALKHAIQEPMDRAERKTGQLTKDIERLGKLVTLARKKNETLAVWETQSLLGDPRVARSLYQAWLVELVDDVRLANPSVSSGEPINRRGFYYSLSFSVRGRGTLDTLTTFLYAFYQTDLLHQIRAVNITPLKQADQIDLSISIEALVLSHVATASARLDQQALFDAFQRRTWRKSNRLASERLEDYEVIVHRNLFGMGGETSMDPTNHTYLTSINMVNGEPEVWLTKRTTDETLKVRQGETFEVGSLSCEIAEIYGKDVIIESDGERWLLTLGDKLTDAHALPPER